MSTKLGLPRRPVKATGSTQRQVTAAKSTEAKANKSGLPVNRLAAFLCQYTFWDVVFLHPTMIKASAAAFALAAMGIACVPAAKADGFYINPEYNLGFAGNRPLVVVQSTPMSVTRLALGTSKVALRSCSPRVAKPTTTSPLRPA